MTEVGDGEPTGRGEAEHVKLSLMRRAMVRRLVEAAPRSPASTCAATPT